MRTLFSIFALSLCFIIQAQTIQPNDRFIDENTGTVYTVREVRMGKYVFMTDEQEGDMITLEKVDRKEGEYTLQPSRQADEPPIPGAKFGWTVKCFIDDEDEINNGRTILAFCNPRGGIIYALKSVQDDSNLPPMFLLAATSDGLLQMVYWTDTEEPVYSEDNADFFEEMHREWALQNKLRSNARQYTKLVVNGDETSDVRYVDEILLNPDGEKIYPGELHGRPQIPSPGARFDLIGEEVTPGDELPGIVLVTDSYLSNHKLMTIKQASEDEIQPLPSAVIRQMEEKYGMRVERSQKCYIIGDRYTYGVLQFEGEYKHPVKNIDPDTKAALALEIIIDGDKVYSYPVEGWYLPDEGPIWNVDDGGEYFPSYIEAAFDGPQGPELYFLRFAPESATTGMMRIANGRLDRQVYAVYHSLIDEDLPVWKKDIEEMKRLYVAEDPHENQDVELTKWAHVYIDYDGEQIWISDETEENGAFFSREDGELKLITTVRANLKPSFPRNNAGNHYLMLSGPAGGPSYYYEVYTLRDGKVVERFNALEVYGEIDGCSLNGKDISAQEGKAYMDAIPEAEEPFIFWQEINQ